MPFLKRPNQPDLHYTVDDFTDPWRNAPYLILQHGFGRSGRFWYSWVPYLARFYKVVRPDIRGLGQSSADFDLERGFTLDACIADLVAIIDDLGADAVHFCGESMGGILGMVLAATHPRRVRTLTLVSSPVYIGSATKKTYALGHASEAEAQQKMGMQAWVAATNRTTRFPPATDAGLLAWYEEEFARNRADVQMAMAKLLHGASAEPYLPRIEAPVLGLYPTAGPITSAEQEAMLTTKIKNLRMVHLPSNFHKVQLLFPAACANHLLHFAAEHDGTVCREN
jgi:3-oxoadipate enol-lactonase